MIAEGASTNQALAERHGNVKNLFDTIDIVILPEVFVIKTKITSAVSISKWNEILWEYFFIVFENACREVLSEIVYTDIVRADNAISEATFPAQLMKIKNAAHGWESDMTDFTGFVEQLQKFILKCFGYLWLTLLVINHEKPLLQNLLPLFRNSNDRCLFSAIFNHMTSLLHLDFFLSQLSITRRVIK